MPGWKVPGNSEYCRDWLGAQAKLKLTVQDVGCRLVRPAW